MTSSAEQAVRSAFEAAHGSQPTGVWFAPGRVNLIGEHTDYNDGFVMPMALDLGATLAASVNSDEVVRVSSLDLGESHELPLAELAPGSGGWQAYLMGVVWALREAGHEVSGVDMVLSSNVPLGAGLSSSAAIECVVVAACCDLFGLDVDLMERARIARTAENQYVGAPTGLLDQAASTLCTLDHALFLDCRSFDSHQIPLPLPARGLELLVLDTHTPHTHVDGEYAERRATCEASAAVLGVPALRDIGLDELDGALDRLEDANQVKRVRHIVTENARVMAAVGLAEQGKLRELAPLLDASHESMRDDFEITVPTVDLAVEAARAAGALGARMTGGGFGGCIIALCESGTGDGIGQQVAQAFADAGHGMPSWFVATPAAGARRLS